MARSPRKSQAQLYVVDLRAGGAIKADLRGILTNFAEEFQSKVVRSAVRAGALVFQDEMQVRAPVGNPNESTDPNYQPGTLRDSIYHYYDVRNSVFGKHIYYVGPNKKKAPHWHMIEYGHFRYNFVTGKKGEYIIATKDRLKDIPGNPDKKFVPAVPFVRPTWEAKSGAAIDAMTSRMLQRIRELSQESV